MRFLQAAGVDFPRHAVEGIEPSTLAWKFHGPQNGARWDPFWVQNRSVGFSDDQSFDSLGCAKFMKPFEATSGNLTRISSLQLALFSSHPKII